jgi:hypothetical protein
MADNIDIESVRQFARRGKLVELFQYSDVLSREVNKRAELVLKAIGYDWYKLNSITVALYDRKGVKLAFIKASVEVNFQQTDIEAEVPVRQFEHLLQTDFAS